MEVHAEITRQYADFAAYAEPDSPCFAAWARAVVEDDAVLHWLEDLPTPKRQPNLVFAAARWHGCPAPAPYDVLREALLGDDGRVAATVLERSTQTNEVGRLATLLPALARAEQPGLGPLALIEVGASAGLCLFPDRFAYRWTTDDGDVRLAGPSAGSHELTCRIEGGSAAGLLPHRLPDVGWRGGIDLHPLDVTDDDAMAWLEALVWPEQDARRERLAAAVDVARADPPSLVAGDLLEELPALVDVAAAHGPVVVLHSAVAAYLDHAERERFVAMMTDLVATGACRWISNEGPGVLPSVTASAPSPPPPGRFVLGLDGTALAFTHGHGAALTPLR